MVNSPSKGGTEPGRAAPPPLNPRLVAVIKHSRSGYTRRTNGVSANGAIKHSHNGYTQCANGESTDAVINQ